MAMPAPREPGLQQRPIRGDREEGQANRGREQADQPEHFAFLRRALETGGDMDRQVDREDRDHQREVDQRGAAQVRRLTSRWA